MPSAHSNGVLNMWYSFRAQRTHFVVIDTETDYKGAPTTPKTRALGGRGGGFGDQMAWLARDLERAQADDDVDWTVVVGHRPVYLSKADSDDLPVDTDKKMRKAVEPLFRRYGVDLYVGAHKHFYERLAPLYDGKVCDERTEACPTYIVHGAAGNNEALSKGSRTHENWVRASDYTHR